MISRLVFLGSLNHTETGFSGLQNGFFGFSSGGYREMGVHFAGVIATVIGGFTRNFLHLYTPPATPGRCKKVHRCNFSNCRET